MRAAITDTEHAVVARSGQRGLRGGFEHSFRRRVPTRRHSPELPSTRSVLEGVIALRVRIFAVQVAHVSEDDLERMIRTQRVPVITEFGSLRSDHGY